MKKNDMAILVITAVIAGVFSLILSQALFSHSKHKLSAEVVDAISAGSDDFKPDPNVFNAQAVNPTKLIQIGDSSNSNPF